jgi:hypothetical protein
LEVHRQVRAVELLRKLYRVETLADEQGCDGARRLRLRQTRTVKYLERRLRLARPPPATLAGMRSWLHWTVTV